MGNLKSCNSQKSRMLTFSDNVSCLHEYALQVMKKTKLQTISLEIPATLLLETVH